MTYVLVGLFWLWQVIAQVFFKYGSESQERWLTCFILGNLFGASSIWFLMKLYTRMQVNLALALGGGGAFLVAQIGLALVFHTRLSLVQWLGIAMVGGGMALASMAAR